MATPPSAVLDPGSEQLSRRAWGTLVVLCGALFLDALDVSMMGVALPPIRSDLGLSTIRILTNNPRKITGIEGFGLKVVEQVPIEVPPNLENRAYLETKRDKLGHRLHHQEQRFEPPGDEA